jgi:hypothetical protein
MNIVELSNESRYETESTGPSGWLRRNFGRPSSAGLAALLVVAGFLLVVASEWYPLVKASFRDPNSDTLSTVHRQLGMMNSETLLQIPYFLIWVVVFMSAGALAFASKARRQVLFGASAGALAVQALIVLPILRTPSMIVFSDPDEATGLVIARGAGTSYLIAAFFALAAAMIVAVGGRVLPAATDGDGRPPMADPAPDAAAGAVPRPSMHDAIAATTPAHGDAGADIEFGWSSHRAQVVDVVELEESVEHAPGKDHDIYRRPQTDRVF